MSIGFNCSTEEVKTSGFEARTPLLVTVEERVVSRKAAIQGLLERIGA